MKQSIKEAGYKYVQNYGYGWHILEDIETGKRELWAVNKNHASYGIKYKNTHLEFVSDYYIQGASSND